ncbi:MAG TPA: hypothetical protein VLI92_02280, partial [Candidatus Saccharimonadales bacterium]|nr:hypothetical protein [Candidatus Saccharimonadales bacterium]
MPKLNIEKTFFIASLPVVGYLMSYFYQFGFYNHFEISYLFIQVTVESTILAVVINIAICAFIIILILIAKGFPNKKEQIQKASFFDQTVGLAILYIILQIVIAYIQINLIFKLLLS